MKYINMILIIGLVLTLMFSGCVQSNETDTIKIGAVLGLTGSGSYLSEYMKKGFDLAQMEINNTGNYKIEIIYEDSYSNNEGAVKATSKLINYDNVNLILGPHRSGSVLSVADILNENKVIAIAPLATSPDITNAGDYIFRNRETGETHGKLLSEYLLKNNYNKIAVIYANASNSIGYKNSFIKNYTDNNGEVIIELNYLEDQIDFSSEITKILSKDPSAIYISSTLGIDGGRIVKELGTAGFKGQIFGTMLFETQDFLDMADSFSENVIFTTMPYDNTLEHVKTFEDKYSKTYTDPMHPAAANAYDALMIFANAINFCESDNSECVKNYLYSMNPYLGVGGLTAFDSNGDVIFKTPLLKTIKNNQFVKYEWYYDKH